MCVLQTAAQKMAEVDIREEALFYSPDTVLIGAGACLDSMGFVNFIVAVEDSFEREFGIVINLAEELASGTAAKDTPLTIGDLIVFLIDLIQQRDDG